MNLLKLPVKLLAIDLDHTLIGFGLKPISSFNAKMIRAISQKLVVVIVTGRSFERSLCYAEALKLRYHICFGGALTYDLQNQNFVAVETVSSRALETITSVVEANPDLFAVFYVLDSKRHKIINFTLNHPNPGFLFHQIKTTSFQTFSTQVFKMQVVRVNVFTKQLLLLDNTHERLNQLADLKITKNYNTVLEITSITGHKGPALATLSQKLGILRSQTMAIVDSLNDYSAVEFVKYAVAMKNAHPTIKKLCQYQTRAFDNDGVGYAIQKLLLV